MSLASSMKRYTGLLYGDDVSKMSTGGRTRV